MTTPAFAWLVGAVVEAGREFLLLTLKILPFFAIGAATGAAVQAWLLARWAARLFGGAGRRSVYTAVTAGALRRAARARRCQWRPACRRRRPRAWGS